MDEIKLRRGNREITFRKSATHFAVRLKNGSSTKVGSLVASLGSAHEEITHVDKVLTSQMELFSIKDPENLEDTMDALRQKTDVEMATHAYSMEENGESLVIPTGTMTVQFKPDVDKATRESIMEEHGLEVVEDLDFLPDGHTMRLTEAAVENPLKIAMKLQQRAEIEVAEPDLNFEVSYEYAPGDTLYHLQWHLKNNGDRLGLLAGADVKAEHAWEVTRGSRGIAVCVMDDGFDLGHPEFSAPNKIIAPRDFGQGDLDPSPVSERDNHGTACAGVAIAEENGEGVVGLAPKCAFLPVRTSGRISDNDIKDLFQYAIDQNADVVSCSWTASSWNFPLSAKMTGIMHKAATIGRKNRKGCVILFAAGNQARPLSGVKDGRTSVQGFGLHQDVICVAASNSRDERSSYSNFGQELAICAPSSGSPGRPIVTTDRRGTRGYMAGDYTEGFGGTSSATPLAAGLAGLMLSVNSELTSAEVKNIMMETADKIDEVNGEYVNGHSPNYGHGRINAYRAVVRAREMKDERLPSIILWILRLLGLR